MATSTPSPRAEFDARLPVLDSLATLSADGRTLFLAVINRSEDRELSASIRIDGWKLASVRPLRVFILKGEDKVAANSFGSATNVNILEQSLRVEGVPLRCKFPAHSASVLELKGIA